MSTRRQFLFTALPAVSLFAAESKRASEFRLPLRSRVEAFKGSGVWNEIQFEQTMAIPETAVGDVRLVSGRRRLYGVRDHVVHGFLDSADGDGHLWLDDVDRRS